VTAKVIYVAIVRLTDKMAADWHIDYLIERGVAVEYWDIVSLVREEHTERGARNPPWLHTLRSFAELEERLRLPENRDAYYVMLLSYVARLAQVFRLLSRYDCRMVRFASGILPRDPVLKWRKLGAWLSTPVHCAKEIASRVKASGLRRTGLVKPFAITFAAGAVPMRGSHDTLKLVPINFFDYDSYVLSRTDSRPRLVEGRYAVFLDSNLPYHSDLTFCGYTRLEPHRYFRALNRFFGLLEQSYGVRIAIAAHPRASYDEASFEGRPLIRMSTAVLVRDAEFVLSHTSTSMSYAVLNNKPLLFLYTADMATHYENSFVREMRCFADVLRAPICNVDEITDGAAVDVHSVDRSAYQRYKYNYLTSPEAENTLTQDIVWRELCVSR
jgi:hypothetical protein